jgi:hypothetical protein
MLIRGGTLLLLMASLVACDSSEPASVDETTTDPSASPDAAPSLSEGDGGEGSTAEPNDAEPNAPAPNSPEPSDTPEPEASVPAAEPEPGPSSTPSEPAPSTPTEDMDAAVSPEPEPSVVTPEPTSTPDSGTLTEPEPVPLLPECDDASGCPAQKHLCEPTVYESSDDPCIEESFIWNGTECASTSHCGCVAGDCSRLHPDVASCESAHAICIPDGCEPQDARSTGNMCGTVEGYAFDGTECAIVICGCLGEECNQIEATPEECQERFSECIVRVPLCSDETFPLVPSDVANLPFEPTYPEYTFSIEDAAAEAAFADWTPAEWLGFEEIASPDESCLKVPGVIGSHCPYPRRLLLQVGDSTAAVDLSLHWHALGSIANPTNVQVRINYGLGATQSFVVRDAETESTLLVVTMSGTSEIALGGSNWGFPPFLFQKAEQLCRSEAIDECNDAFAPTGLAVIQGTERWELPPLTAAVIEHDGESYTVLHGYLFVSTRAEGDLECSRVYNSRQTFAMVRGE